MLGGTSLTLSSTRQILPNSQFYPLIHKPGFDLLKTSLFAFWDGPALSPGVFPAGDENLNYRYY
jgi:hypothetical protein